MSAYDEYHDRKHEPSGAKSAIIIISVIGGIILVVLVVCGGLAYLMVKAMTDMMKPMMDQMQQAMEDMQKSQGVADGFLADIRNDQLNVAYDSTTEAFKSQLTREEFGQLVEKHPALKQPARNLGMDAAQTPPPSSRPPPGQPQPQPAPFGPAIYRYRYSAEDKQSKERLEITITVVKDNGVLKVDEFKVYQVVSP